MLKVGDKVVRNDGYSRGLVVAVLADATGLDPFHQVVIRQRQINMPNKKDTVVTRDLEGFTGSKYNSYQFVKEKKKVVAERFYIHWVSRGGTLNTSAFGSLADRDQWLHTYKSAITLVKETKETITYEVDEDV